MLLKRPATVPAQESNKIRGKKHFNAKSLWHTSGFSAGPAKQVSELLDD